MIALMAQGGITSGGVCVEGCSLNIGWESWSVLQVMQSENKYGLFLERRLHGVELQRFRVIMCNPHFDKAVNVFPEDGLEGVAQYVIRGVTRDIVDGLPYIKWWGDAGLHFTTKGQLELSQNYFIAQARKVGMDDFDNDVSVVQDDD